MHNHAHFKPHTLIWAQKPRPFPSQNGGRQRHAHQHSHWLLPVNHQSHAPSPIWAEKPRPLPSQNDGRQSHAHQCSHWLSPANHQNHAPFPRSPLIGPRTGSTALSPQKTTKLQFPAFRRHFWGGATAQRGRGHSAPRPRPFPALRAL